MKVLRLVVTSLAVAIVPSSGSVNFDTAETGKPPSGWTAGQTGSGQARWAVVADDTAPSKPNVLKRDVQGGR